MNSPLTISFPVMDAPSHIGKGRVILLQFAAITDARGPGVPSTYGKVIGMLDNGKMIQFTIPVKTWEEARRNPVYFVEADNVRGAAGALIDKLGNTLASTNKI